MSISERPHEYALLRWIDLESTKIDERLMSILPDFELGDLHNKKTNIIKTNLNNPKVLLCSFFAEWCPNCHYDAITIQKLFSNYEAMGLKIVLTMDYSSKEKSLSFVKKYELKMPIAFGELGEKNEEKRNHTQFYQFRKALGDPRGWGAPFHIIIKNGDQNNVGIIMGEIEENQIMCFLKEALRSD